MTILELTLRNSHDWAIDRIHFLCELQEDENAYAIQSEFSEWMNPDIFEHDVLSLEFIGEQNDLTNPKYTLYYGKSHNRDYIMRF